MRTIIPTLPNDGNIEILPHDNMLEYFAFRQGDQTVQSMIVSYCIMDDDGDENKVKQTSDFGSTGSWLNHSKVQFNNNSIPCAIEKNLSLEYRSY